MSLRKRIPFGLVVAIVAYVALRAAILWTNFDATALPMYELYPMGTMAELELRGIDFPIRYFYDNAAGQILMGYLTVPYFWLFGSSYLALKLLPATIGLATLVLVWRFLDKNFSRNAANCGAWLFAVGPPTLVKYSLICSGNHFENLFFTLLAIACFYRFHGGKPTFGALFLAAFTAGFALFVFLGAIIPVGILLGMHLGLRGLRQALKDAGALVPGFLVGLAPLLLVNLATGGRGLGFLDAKFGAENSGRSGAVIERMAEFLGPELLKCGVFEPFLGLSGAMWSVLFVSAFALATLASLPSVSGGVALLLRGLVQPPRDAASAFERVKLVPFVISVPLAALAYGLSNFRLGGDYGPVDVAGYRYYLPTLLFAVVLIAVWTARWWERGGSQRVAGATLALTAIACGLTSLGAVDRTAEFAGAGSHYDGYNLAQVARALLSTRNAVPHDQVVSIVESLPPDVRQRVVTAIGFNLGVREVERRVDGPGSTVDVARICEPYPAWWHLSLLHGVESALRWKRQMAGRDGLDLATIRSRIVAPSSLERLAHTHLGLLGILSPGVNLPLSSDVPQILAANRLVLNAALSRADPASATLNRFDPELLAAHGYLLGRLFMRGSPPDVRPSLEELASLQASPYWHPTAFWRGFGVGLVWNTDERPIPAPVWSLVSGEDRRALGKGIGYALHRLQLHDFRAVVDLEREGAPVEVLEAARSEFQVPADSPGIE